MIDFCVVVYLWGAMSASNWNGCVYYSESGRNLQKLSNTFGNALVNINYELKIGKLELSA